MFRWQYWLYAAWFSIVLRYRKTFLGPLWLIAAPAAFISMLGVLYARISNLPLDVFIPYMGIGFLIWGLITSLVNSGANLLVHSRPKIIQGGLNVDDLIIVNLSASLLQFAHRAFVGIGLYIIYRWELTPYALVSLLGIVIILINGYWYGVVFGFLGARFRDVSEVVATLIGALFFVTPIIWMPDESGRGGILGPYLTYNPFYHFVEIVRAPILGQPVELFSWIVVSVITIVGLVTAFLVQRAFYKKLPLWI